MKPDFSRSPDSLVPAIVQDNQTQVVLMLGYMNAEAFEKTKTENRVTFFSRSKKRLWTKGEESGNFLDVNAIHLDCDNDTLLIKATPAGPVCHTGSDTCWNETNKPASFLHQLEQIIHDRKNNPEKKLMYILIAAGIFMMVMPLLSRFMNYFAFHLLFISHTDEHHSGISPSVCSRGLQGQSPCPVFLSFLWCRGH